MPVLAVLLMAYGTPSSEEDTESYLTDIMRGRKPSSAVVEKLKERYRRIGGRSPLLEITRAQACALGKVLSTRGVNARVYVGMRHWHPYISEVVPQILNDGSNRIIALALAPHYSQISTGGYKQALERALGTQNTAQVDFVDSWYDNPTFNRAVAERVRSAMESFPNPSDVEVLFTAHSLPVHLLNQSDPYPEQLRNSCEAIADLLKLGHWSFAYQSAGETGEKWLGPDILEILQQLGAHRKDANVLVVPIGFVADHLEILYDIDVEAQETARQYGVNLRRVESLNTSPTFIAALADIISKCIGENTRP